MNTENLYRTRVNSLLQNLGPVPPQERYSFLIDKGRSRADATGAGRETSCFIRTCHSRTWLDAEFRQGRLHLEAGSDSLIVRGIIALLTDLLNGLTAEEAVSADPADLDSLNLEQYLKNSRSNILRHIFTRVRDIARENTPKNTPRPVNSPSRPTIS